MSKAIRASKYRHVFGTEYKKELCYDNIKLSSSAFDSNFIKVNPKFIAVLWASAGGGSFVIIPIEKTGKLPTDYPLFNGHSALVNDVDFNPFNDNIIASSGEDCLVKVWQIPEGGAKTTQTTAAATLSGHQKKAGIIQWHPTAANILSSTSADCTVKVWDVETSQAKLNIGDHADQIQSITWNYDGSMCATTCKDKFLRLIDPRSQAVVSSTEAHYGAKGSRLVWLGNKERIFTNGFSKTSEREFKIWDPRNLTDPLSTYAIDNAAGMMMPFYDEDTAVLYLAGKGDGSIKYYEMIDEAPYYYGLSEYKSPAPQKGVALLSKRGCNVSKCEIGRFYKLAATSNSTTIVPIEMSVPRKGDQFQADIFPDTRAYEPSHSSAAWFSGGNAQPKLVSMKPGDNAQSSSSPAALTLSSPVAALEAENAVLKARVAELEAELAALKAQ
jgi:coronin-1B/1C/6